MRSQLTKNLKCLSDIKPLETLLPISAQIAFLSFKYLYRFTSCKEANFAPSCYLKPI